MAILRSLVRSMPRGTRDPVPTPVPRPEWGPGYLIPATPGSGVSVQNYPSADDKVMAIPAAWRCMNMIGGLIAQMPLTGFSKEPINEPLESQPQIITRPWPILTYFDWVFCSVMSMVLHGDMFAIKADYDEATGRPRQLIPIHPDDVYVDVFKGLPYYDVSPLGKTYSYEQMLHIRGFMLPGSLTGIGVVEAHRKNIHDTKALQDFGANAYTSGAVPPVVITVNKSEITEAEVEYLQTRWMLRHHSGNRVPAVVPKIVEVQPIGLSMADAEYLESRKFSVAEIAFMFNLSPEDLSTSMGGPGLTYANVESKVRERLLYCLQPWMSRIEQAFTDLMPGSQYTRFDTSTVLRSDAPTRIKMYSDGLEAGIYTLNEIRRWEGMPLYESWADEPFGTPPAPEGAMEQLSSIPQEAELQMASTNGNGDGAKPVGAEDFTIA